MPNNWKKVTKKTLRLFVQDDLVKSSWFSGKDNYMFRAVTDKTHRGETSAVEMLALVKTRSEFLCKVIFGAHTKACLHNSHDEAEQISIPGEIEHSRISGGRIVFTAVQQKCTAQALGSVTLLSDLDFTINCNSRDGIQNDTALQQAYDEIYIADKITEAIEQILGTGPAVIFDTNVYTNTYSYGPALGQDCDADPLQGVAIGLYAVARGFMQIADYANNMHCGQFGLNANPSGLKAERYRDHEVSLPSRFLKEMLQDNPRVLGALRPFAPRIRDMVGFVAGEREVAEASRVDLYFHALRNALADIDHFCIKTAFALILANEAYWVPGAIKDVVESKTTLTVSEATESVLMNLGYAMEHTVHEFSKGDRSPSGDIMMCNYGDGLIKLGKYVHRAKLALAKANMTTKDLQIPEVQHLFAAAQALKTAKANASANEKHNPIALPQEYVEQYKNNIEKIRGGTCGVVDLLASASMAVVKFVFAAWT